MRYVVKMWVRIVSPGGGRSRSYGVVGGARRQQPQRLLEAREPKANPSLAPWVRPGMGEQQPSVDLVLRRVLASCHARRSPSPSRLNLPIAADVGPRAVDGVIGCDSMFDGSTNEAFLAQSSTQVRIDFRRSQLSVSPCG